MKTGLTGRLQNSTVMMGDLVAGNISISAVV
jgi:hypothetical protein